MVIAHKGLKGAPSSAATILVQDYCNRVAMRKLGYSIDLKVLSQFEVEAFTLIASELARLQREDMDESRKKNQRKRR